MADPFVTSKQPGAPLFFGGFHGLTEEGLPRYIQNQYEASLTNAAAFTYNGMWRAAGSGIIRGMALTGLGSLVVAAIAGMVTGPAEGYLVIDGINNAINGVYNLMSNTTLGASLFAMGAAAGAVYDVFTHRDNVKKELLVSRQLLRNHAAGLTEPDLSPAQAEQVSQENLQQLKAIQQQFAQPPEAPTQPEIQPQAPEEKAALENISWASRVQSMQAMRDAGPTRGAL